MSKHRCALRGDLACRCGRSSDRFLEVGNRRKGSNSEIDGIEKSAILRGNCLRRLDAGLGATDREKYLNRRPLLRRDLRPMDARRMT